VTGDEHETWREQRRVNSAFHADEVERRKRLEGEQAQRLIDRFVREARSRGLPSQPLLAKSYSTGARYRTGLQGWYIRRDKTLGVDVRGGYYVLTVAAGPLARLTGVTLTVDVPPLVVGVGARDGESRPMADLLQDRLNGD
jgi:hypothetical protein